ncbi:MAG: hypothetical protein WA705_14800 [Candidatus Ozemobacteraceae bacterium]
MLANIKGNVFFAFFTFFAFIFFGSPNSAFAQEIPTGKLLYYSSEEMKFSLMDVKTKSETKLPLPADAHHPALSPDGTAIAYIGERDKMFIYHLDSGSEVVFNNARSHYSSPAFVSNSTIAYLREDREGVQLFLSPTDKAVERKWKGKYPTEQLSSPAIEYLSKSGEDNPMFVMAARNRASGSKLLMLSSEAPKTILVTPTAGDHLRFPDVSPDGKTIVFSRDIPGGIWAIDISGENLRQLDFKGSWPKYSSDGQFIAFLTKEAVTRGLAIVNIQTGQEVGRTGGGSLMSICIMSSDGKSAFPLLNANSKPLHTRGDNITWR